MRAHGLGELDKALSRNAALLIGFSQRNALSLVSKHLVIRTEAAINERLVQEHLIWTGPLSILALEDEVAGEKAGVAGLLLHQRDEPLKVPSVRLVVGDFRLLRIPLFQNSLNLLRFTHFPHTDLEKKLPSGLLLILVLPGG